MTRTIVVGDIHGCYDELMELLEKIGWNPSSSEPDVLVLAGDLVDRGPKSLEVVRWARESHAKHGNLVRCVVGNHDERYPRYAKNLERKHRNPSYVVNMRLDKSKKDLFSTLTKEDLSYLQNLPSYIQFGNWVVVHAGLEPKKSLEEQDPGKMQHIRYVDPLTLKTKGLTEDYDQPTGTVYWTEVYDLPYNVVYGHMVHSLENPRFDKGPQGQVLVGLDTGSCFGGALSAYVLETGEVFSVKAHKNYAELWRLGNSGKQ